MSRGTKYFGHPVESSLFCLRIWKLLTGEVTFDLSLKGWVVVYQVKGCDGCGENPKEQHRGSWWQGEYQVGFLQWLIDLANICVPSLIHGTCKWMEHHLLLSRNWISGKLESWGCGMGRTRGTDVAFPHWVCGFFCGWVWLARRTWCL